MPMSANDALKQIPIAVERVPGASRLHGWRRASQYLTLLILILIPVSGLFRIDPEAGAFVLLDRQVWFSDILIVMGFWMFVASLLVMMYSLVGAVFCGWMCPQNTVSEWANEITRKLLGRRAMMMNLTGEKMQVAARRRSLANYLVLGALLLAAAMVYALLPLLYFYPPSAIWSFITFQDDARLAPSLHWIYMVCVAVMLLDIAVIRHLMCKYMCIYRVWQHSFKTKETLRIAYDASRADHCKTCNYCVDACFLDIDPRRTDVFDSCVNCGECIRACDELHAKSRKLEGPGLLRFTIGRGDGARKGTALGSFFARARAASMFTLVGAALFGWGIASYEPADFTVYRGEAWQGAQVLDYRVNIAWKLYRPTDMTIAIQGLPEGMAHLARRKVHFDTVGRVDVPLHLDARLAKGVHRFTVTVRTADGGWQKSFRVVHYAPGMAAGTAEQHTRRRAHG